MQKTKKLLALVLSIALILSCCPVFLASAEETTQFTYASKLDAVVGNDIINHDYSAMTELPAEITGSASLSATAALDGEKTLTFANWWKGDGADATIEIGRENFAARITMVVDNVQTQRIGGTFSFSTVGKNENDVDTVASYIRIALPDRDAGAPFPGNVIYYNEGAEYQFTNVSGVTPFTTDSAIETLTLEIYSFNGVNYYCKEDGTLIGASAHKTGVTGATSIKLSGEYGLTYVTDLIVKELNVTLPEDLFENEKLPEVSGFATGEDIANFDFSKLQAGTTPEGWTFSSSSIGKGSSDTAGKNVLRLNNTSGVSRATFKLPKNNFAALITVGMDYAQTLSGQVKFGVNDANGNSAAYWSIGLPKRSAENWPKAGKSCIRNGSADSSFAYPATGDYAFSTTGYTTVDMIMYFYNGSFTFVWGDGRLVYSVDANPEADLEGELSLVLENDWAVAYIHSLRIVDIAPYTVPEPYYLVDTSGFIAGDKILDFDFSKFEAGSTPEGWTFSSSSIGKGSLDTAAKNVLRLSNTTGVCSAMLNVPAENFAAVMTFGVDHSQTLAGQLKFGTYGVVNGEDKLGSYWSIGLPKRSESNWPKAGKSCVYNNNWYYYPSEGDVTWEEDGYSTITMVMYVYEGMAYYYWPNGTLVKEITQGASLEGGAKIYLGNDWASAYVHDLKVYEIIPNSLKSDSASVLLENGAPNLNVNFSWDNSAEEIISSENFEFGAVVTVKDGSDAENTTIETENAEIWALEATNAGESVLKFANSSALAVENVDKYVNVRTFVKEGDKYYYGAPTTYNIAKLADILYRSVTSEDDKAVIEEFFKDSKNFYGKDSKKITFTVFSDFHYKQGMYVSSIADMNEIFDRANASGSSFVLSAGDMTNDMLGSPELVNAFKNNKYGLPAANVYGNHELESGGNSMAVVTPTLTNADAVWGTADGKMDVNIGYFYFDVDGFRVICTDTNYSWDPTNQIWEHSETASYGPPTGNTNVNALGPVQLAWLEEVLYDAGENNIPCIVMSHAALRTGWSELSADAAAAEEIFRKVNADYPGTVMMHIAGHAHDDIIEYEDDIVWFRANVTRNGYWKAAGTDHYGENDTFMMETYDVDGNFLGYEEKKLNTLTGGRNTHFFEEALSATVTIDSCGIITIDGMETPWLNGVEPDLTGIDPHIRPQISNYASFDCANGHVWADEYVIDGSVHYKECIHPECTITEKEEYGFYGEHEYVNGVCVCGKKDAGNIENGDINGDSSINAADLALLKKIIAGLTPVDDAEVANPNVDDIAGIPNAADLALLKKIIAGLA